jgi:hypothetical protein
VRPAASEEITTEGKEKRPAHQTIAHSQRTHTHDIRTHKHHATPVLALTAHVTAHALIYSTTGTPIAMAGLRALGASRNLRYSTGKRCGIGVLAHSNQYMLHVKT